MNQLPTVAAGTPPYAKVRVMLSVLRETENALQVTRDRWADGPTAWLPKSAAFRHNPNNFGGDERIDVKVWAYARLRDNLEAR